jgi:RNA polymerase sigma-70 factor (ECF subfamily)
MREDVRSQTYPFTIITNPNCLDTSDLVERHYRSLYRFALSLTHSEAEACDLTQHTFYTWQAKGDQLRDPAKARTWLFTTLHHAFLQLKRRERRFHHHELSEVDSELPCVSPQAAEELDSADVLRALSRVEDPFRAPLALFYLEEYPYKEIAQILNLPLGTVKSRISRGIIRLQTLLGLRDHSGQLVAA